MNKDLLKKYDEIKHSFEQLGKNMADISNMAGEELQEYGQDAAENVKETVQQVVKGVSEKAQDMKKIAAENPLVVVAAFSATAFLLGYFLNQCKSKNA